MNTLVAFMIITTAPPPNGGNFIWELNRIANWNRYCVAPALESKNPRDYICVGEGLEAQDKKKESK